MRAQRHTTGDGVLAPSTDAVFPVAYRCGQVAALVVAVLFASAHGMVVAGSGLVIALVGFRVFVVWIRGIVFPVIEVTSRAVGRALGDE